MDFLYRFWYQQLNDMVKLTWLQKVSQVTVFTVHILCNYSFSLVLL